MKKQIPVTCPTQKQVQDANNLISQVNLHYFQLLYFNNFHKNSKGFNNFFVNTPYLHHGIVAWKIECTKDSSYNFFVFPQTTKELQDEQDKIILEMCGLILEELRKDIKEKKITNCCSLAVQENCVCFLKTSCVLHGTKCCGTHD